MATITTQGRPGTLVSVGSSGIIPQPLASFNTTYMVVSVPGDVYSPLQANVPIQVTNLDDYLNLIGGEVPSPTTDWAAYQSYQSVKLFFRNATNGILFVTRTAPTPSVQIIVPNTAGAGGVGTTQFVISVNGVYFGSRALIDTNTGQQAVDAQGAPIFYIPTTGVDAPDNGYDIVQALEEDPRFDAGFYISRTDVEAQSGVFNIFSRNAKTLISVEEFGYVDGTGTVQSFLSTSIPASGGLVWARGEQVTATDIGAVELFAHTQEFKARLQSKGFQLYEVTVQGDGATVYEAWRVAIPDDVPGFIVPEYFENNVPMVDDRIYMLGWGRSETNNDVAGQFPANTARLDQFIIKSVTPDGVPPAGYSASWVIEVADSSDAYFDGGTLPVVFTPEPADAVSGYPKLMELHRPQSVQIHYINVNSENIVSITNGITGAGITSESQPGAGDGLLISLQELLGNGYIVEDIGEPLTEPLTAILKVTSKSGIPAYLFPGRDRQSILDENVEVNELSKVYAFQANGYIQPADYIHTIENSFDPEIHAQGFLLAPEAFARFVTDEFGQLNAFTLTKGEAQNARLAIASAMELQVSKQGFEWVALIDCGGDITNHTEAQIELQLYKNRIASPQGHSAYFAPYMVDLEGNRVPPTAAVAGIALARYAAEGFQEPPAGVRYPVRGVTDVDFTITAVQQDVSNPLGLNAIRILTNRGIVVWGARTMSSNPLFAFINVRVILNVLVGTLRTGFDTFIFSNIDGQGQLLSKIKGTAIEICQQLWRGGALFGATPTEAYAVIADENNNLPANLEQGVVNVDVFVVPSPTLERLVISVNRTAIGGISFTIGRLI